MVEIQNQMQQLETRHNQELIIVPKGVNRNMRQIGEITHRLGNPQQQVRSAGTYESRLPSTFHLAASNDQHVPIAPGFSDHVWEGDNQVQNHEKASQAEENRASYRDDPGSPHT